MAKKTAPASDRDAKQAPESQAPESQVPEPQTPAEAEAQAAKRAEESRQRTEYERLLDNVRAAAVMTATPAWQALYRTLGSKIEAHKAALLVAEKPREVVQHQESVKIIQFVMNAPGAPVGELNAFVTAAPLLARPVIRARWNGVLGVVEIDASR